MEENMNNVNEGVDNTNVQNEMNGENISHEEKEDVAAVNVENENVDNAENTENNDAVKVYEKEVVKEKTEEEIKKEVYDRKKKVEEEISTLRRKKEVKEEKYRSLEKTKDAIIDDKVKEAQIEISKTYDEMLYQADAKLKVAEEQKRREKSQLEKNRISKETKTFVEDNEQIKDVIKQKIREYKLPMYVNSNLFFSLFMPSTIGEFIKFILAILICFVVIPMGLFYMIGRKLDFMGIMLLVIIYVVAFVIFGGLYLVIYNATVDKKKEELKEIHEFKKDYVRNKNRIKNITHNIKNDKDETNYDLQNVDAKIRKAKKELEDIQGKKLSALKQFEENVKLTIIRDVERMSSKDISEAAKQLDEVVKELDEKENELRKIQEEILSKYEIKEEVKEENKEENKEEGLENTPDYTAETPTNTEDENNA